MTPASSPLPCLWSPQSSLKNPCEACSSSSKTLLEPHHLQGDVHTPVLALRDHPKLGPAFLTASPRTYHCCNLCLCFSPQASFLLFSMGHVHQDLAPRSPLLRRSSSPFILLPTHFRALRKGHASEQKIMTARVIPGR